MSWSKRSCCEYSSYPSGGVVGKGEGPEKFSWKNRFGIFLTKSVPICLKLYSSYRIFWSLQACCVWGRWKWLCPSCLLDKYLSFKNLCSLFVLCFDKLSSSYRTSSHGIGGWILLELSWKSRNNEAIIHPEASENDDEGGAGWGCKRYCCSHLGKPTSSWERDIQLIII